MTHQAILTASLFLLLAFGIDRLNRSTGIPSVVALIVTGLLGKPALAYFGLELSGLDAAVPVIGTVGLILIVLEGAFDLELRRDKLGIAANAFVAASLGFVLATAAFALLAATVLSLNSFQAMLLAIPFAVISSAVAIPSCAFLPTHGREFIVYESSVSDIIGILAFFALLESDGTLTGVLRNLVGGGALSLVLGAACAIGLLVALLRIDGHIRFIPLLAGLFALYAGGKLLHLSPLIMVLMFGLVLNNPGLLGRWGWIHKLVAAPGYDTTVREFKSLTAELTFAVRGFFFILLGYWTDLSGFASFKAWLVAILVVAGIYGARKLILRLLRVELADPLTWIAPRGLITILLYLSVKEAVAVPPYLDGAVMLIVLASALAIGLGRYRWEKATPDASAAR